MGYLIHTFYGLVAPTMLTRFRYITQVIQKIQTDTIYFKEDAEFINNELTFKLDALNENNTIYIDYAGSGKTHHIINNIIST